MNAQYRLLAGGGFACGDVETGITAYAYPTSDHATRARRQAGSVAAEMLRDAIAFRPFCSARVDLAGYDARNWQQIRGEA